MDRGETERLYILDMVSDDQNCPATAPTAPPPPNQQQYHHHHFSYDSYLFETTTTAAQQQQQHFMNHGAPFETTAAQQQQHFMNHGTHYGTTAAQQQHFSYNSSSFEETTASPPLQQQCHHNNQQHLSYNSSPFETTAAPTQNSLNPMFQNETPVCSNNLNLQRDFPQQNYQPHHGHPQNHQISMNFHIRNSDSGIPREMSTNVRCPRVNSTPQSSQFNYYVYTKYQQSFFSGDSVALFFNERRDYELNDIVINTSKNLKVDSIVVFQQDEFVMQECEQFCKDLARSFFSSKYVYLFINLAPYNDGQKMKEVIQREIIEQFEKVERPDKEKEVFLTIISDNFCGVDLNYILIRDNVTKGINEAKWRQIGKKSYFQRLKSRESQVFIIQYSAAPHKKYQSGNLIRNFSHEIFNAKDPHESDKYVKIAKELCCENDPQGRNTRNMNDTRFLFGGELALLLLPIISTTIITFSDIGSNFVMEYASRQGTSALKNGFHYYFNRKIDDKRYDMRDHIKLTCSQKLEQDQIDAYLFSSLRDESMHKNNWN